MKRICVVSALVLLLLTAVGPGAAEKVRFVDFTLFLRDDTVLSLGSKDRRLAGSESAFDIVIYEKDGESFKETRRIEWPKIAREIYSIDLINANLFVYDRARLLLTGQDGAREVVEHGSLRRTDGGPLKDFYFNQFNRIASRWTRRSVPIERVKKVVLGTTRLMVNTDNGTLYPPDYRFDPYTGAPLTESAIEAD
jgi:hypothetical protein